MGRQRGPQQGLPGSSCHSHSRAGEQALRLPFSCGRRNAAEPGSEIAFFQWQKGRNNGLLGPPVSTGSRYHCPAACRQLGTRLSPSQQRALEFWLAAASMQLPFLPVWRGQPPSRGMRRGREAFVYYGGEQAHAKRRLLSGPFLAYRAGGLKCVLRNFSALCPLMTACLSQIWCIRNCPEIYQ